MAIVDFKSNEQLDAEANELRASTESTPYISGLAAHIEQCFGQAKTHKATYITPELLKCKAQRRGEYDSVTLAKIRQQGGASEEYFNETATKCLSLESQLRDVLIPIMDKLFQLDPTPIPSLPDDVKQTVIDQVAANFAGITPLPSEVQQFTLDLADQTMRDMFGEAKKRVERMEKRIQDDCAEGGFSTALSGFIKDFCMYPFAVLKGPVRIPRRKLDFDRATNKPSVAVKVVPTWECVSPFNLFWSPAAKSIQDDFVCEVGSITPRVLQAMRGQPGWNTEAIERVLSSAETTSTSDIAGNSERALYDYRSATAPSTSKTYVEFWGAVQGSLLKEWNIPLQDGVEIDDIEYYDIQAMKIGSEVVYAVLNPDPLGSPPYFIASYDYEDSTSSIMGESLPKRMRDCQNKINAAGRNLDDNLAEAAGPQIAVDVYSLAAGENCDSYPRRVWQYDGSKTQGARQPVYFFQPNSNADELMKVIQFYSQIADDRTQVPRYTYGNADLKGAGETASGLSMLLNNLSKGVKRMLAEIESSVVVPAITRMYNWLMLYDPDDSIKGDAQVVPRGILAILVKEQVQIRRQEFIALVDNSPTALEIVGIEGYAQLLREVAKDLTTDVSKIVPDDDVLRARHQQAMLDQQAMMAQGVETQGVENAG